MKQFLLLIIGTSFTFSLCVGGTSPNSQEDYQDSIKIKKIIRQLGKQDIYVADGIPNKSQEENFRKFSQAGSTYDFMKIAMQNKNPLIRLFAFKVVAEKMDNLPPELVEKFLEDSTLIKVQFRNGIKEVPTRLIANGFLK
jgi:hypothetical protein